MAAPTELSEVAHWVATGPPAFVVRPLYQKLELQLWKARGRRGLTPHAVKQEAVREYSRRYQLRIMVETGTYLGDMVWAMRRDFRDIHSVELDPALHARAVFRLRRLGHVRLWQGDSARVLGEIVTRLEEPALFWLDGHYSGGITARGESDTPVLAELTHVFGDRRHSHVALIDDAVDFMANADYPSIADLEKHLHEIRTGLTVAVAENIIRVHQT